MKKRSKIRMSLMLKFAPLIIIISFLLSGCWNATEINELEMVIGMAVDKEASTDNVKLTAQIVKPGEMSKPSGKGGGSEPAKAWWNVSTAMPTIFDAAREITHTTGNKLFVSHSQIVIFSNDIAENGINKYLDFFMRAHGMRPNTLVVISNGKAADILEAEFENEKLPAMGLANIIKSGTLTSHLLEINLQDFSERMLRRTSSPIAPLVSVSVENNKKVVDFSGMVVFKTGKLTGHLDKSETRGLLWVMNKVKSGVINVDAPDGKGKVAFEIMKATSETKPEIKNGKIYFDVAIKADTSLVEQNTDENLATLPMFEKLQQLQEDVIRKEIMASLRKSKELKCDIYDFGEMLDKKYNREWKELKDNWDEAYQDIELMLEVEVKIRRTDLLTKPVAPKKD